MKVFYKSTIAYQELEPGHIFRTIPDRAFIKLEKENSDSDFHLILDGELINSDVNEIECKPEMELVISQNGYYSSYCIKPIVHPVSNEYMLAYEQFSFEFGDKETNEIDAVKSGCLRMYAAGQIMDINDWSNLFDLLEDSFNAIKTICDKPNSHLRAVNEVRPIETVKRIGYEAIPYLAAHSEDWLARTASGLKPARLFSRVEEDDYQIYENRVVKTLVDLIIDFLRKREKELKTQYEQLHSIINSSIQVGSFGFDASFQIAVSELFVIDDTGEKNRSKAFQMAEKLHKRTAFLLKRYRTLKKTRLYRYLKKTKPVTNPLNETNILMMDNHYKEVFKLWKAMQRATAPLVKKETIELEYKYAFNDYLLYCKTLCGYAAHIIGFKIEEDGQYYRDTDNISLRISDVDGLIHCHIKDETKRSMPIVDGLESPIAAGEEWGHFFFDGDRLFWDDTICDDDIEEFCNILKHKAVNGKKSAEQKKKYQALKIAISDCQRKYPEAKRAHFVIWPASVEIENETRNFFREITLEKATRLIEENNIDYFVVALPRCEEAEQKIINYAKYDGERILYLPLTMFDINSYRRIQNLLIRLIVSFGNDKCPCCGNTMRKYENQLVCDNCNQLTLTKTMCPNSECKSEYFYLSYDVSDDTIDKMMKVSENNFFQWDSLYQYKDIGPMTITDNKIRAVCPCCGR